MVQRLIAEVRQNRILSAVRRDGIATVAALTEELGVAPVTVRRDIAALVDRGLARRVHGGVATPTRRRPTSGVGGLTMAMVVPADHYWTVISYSAQGEALSGGARFMLRNTPGSGPQMQEVANALVKQLRPDGLILAPPITEPDRTGINRWLVDQEICSVVVDRRADDTAPLTQSVGSDHARGAALGARHLHGLGHRRVALVHQPHDPAGLAEIRSGWESALHQLAMGPGLTLEVARSSRRDRQPRFADLFAQLRDHRVTAVMVTGHPHAVSFAQACHEEGIEVPDDLSVLAYGDTETVLSHPPLSAVRPPRELVGRTAVRLLGDHLREGTGHRLQQLLLSPTVVARTSTAPPATQGRTDRS